MQTTKGIIDKPAFVVLLVSVNWRVVIMSFPHHGLLSMGKKWDVSAELSLLFALLKHVKPTKSYFNHTLTLYRPEWLIVLFYYHELQKFMQQFRLKLQHSNNSTLQRVPRRKQEVLLEVLLATS